MSATILVVDDEPNILSFLEQVLQDEGNLVQTTGYGAEAVKLMREQCPDTIGSDIIMPVLDGVTLCQRVHAEPQTSHIPIILMSAVVRPVAPEVYDYHAFVAKPIDLDALLHTLP